MAKTLDRRALNRALLARQHLLARTDISVSRALDRLIALQAQAGPAPYFALWARLKTFTPQDLSTRLEDLSVARGTLMRGTLHVALAADFAAIRPLIQRGLDRVLTEGSVHGRALAGLDPAEVAWSRADLLRRGAAHRDPIARRLGGGLARSRSPGLGDGGARPSADAAAAAARSVGARRSADPGGDGRSARNTRTGPEPWPISVLRYLAAFGPASVADAQIWLGLSRLAATFEVLRPSWSSFTTMMVRNCSIYPRPSRPSGDTECARPLPGRVRQRSAGPRRPDADHVGRSQASALHAPTASCARLVLVDGFTAGRWRIEDGKAASVLHDGAVRQGLQARSARPWRTRASACWPSPPSSAGDDVRIDDRRGLGGQRLEHRRRIAGHLVGADRRAQASRRRP